MKKFDLIALAKTMISSSFPALRGMTLRVKIIDTDDSVMSVRLERKEIHLEVSREGYGNELLAFQQYHAGITSPTIKQTA